MRRRVARAVAKAVRRRVAAPGPPGPPRPRLHTRRRPRRRPPPRLARHAAGRPSPALAAALPERTPAGARVTLRPGLVTARGAAIAARDVIASLDRSRRGGGRASLSAFGAFRAVRGAPLAIEVEAAT